MDTNVNNNNYNNLEELGGSHFEIVDGQPDIKGWDVKNEQGKKIGEVDELLFDPSSRKVRYLIVDIDDNDLDLDDDKKVLIPIGVAELYTSKSMDDDTDDDDDIDDDVNDNNIDNTNDAFIGDGTDTISNDQLSTQEMGENNKRNNLNRDYKSNDSDLYNATDDGDVVIVPITINQLTILPKYEKNMLTPDLESTIRRVFEGGEGAMSTYNKDDFYSHSHFDENKFYRTGIDRGTEKWASNENNLNPDKGEGNIGSANTSWIRERRSE